MNSHIKKAHHDNVPFECFNCFTSFPDFREFKRHADVCFRVQENSSSDASNVTAVSPFVCTVCNKGFNWQCQLQQHSVVHTGERPYECNECGKRFTQVSNMNSHIKRVHREKVPFECFNCHMNFSNFRQFKRHAEECFRVEGNSINSCSDVSNAEEIDDAACVSETIT